MPAPSPYDEKRKYFRVTPSLSNPILTTIYGQNLKLKSLPVRDISLGGISFYMPKEINSIPVGTMIPNFQLTIPQKGPINASGVVRRVDNNFYNKRNICALEFTRMPAFSDQKLYNYLNGRQREIGWFSKN